MKNILEKTNMLKDLPHKVKGLTITDGDEYTVIINSRCSYEQQLKTAQHEHDHIKEDDFFSLQSADKIERGSHE